MAIAEEIIYHDMEYHALSETFRAQVTFQQFVSIKNPRWSKDDVALWAKKMEEVNYWSRRAEENRAKEVRKVDRSPHASRLKGEHRLILQPLEAGKFATVAKSFRSQIRDAGVKGECITLRYTMIAVRRMCMRMRPWMPH